MFYFIFKNFIIIIIHDFIQMYYLFNLNEDYCAKLIYKLSN